MVTNNKIKLSDVGATSDRYSGRCPAQFVYSLDTSEQGCDSSSYLFYNIIACFLSMISFSIDYMVYQDLANTNNTSEITYFFLKQPFNRKKYFVGGKWRK